MGKPTSRYVAKYEISKIIVMAGNAKDHPNYQIEQLKTNIKKYGFTAPVLVTGRGELIAGHGRLQAARELGLVSVPAVVLDGLTLSDARALRISDNRISELGEINSAALTMELVELSAELDDLDGLGFMADEIGHMLADYTIDDGDQEQDDPEHVPVGDHRNNDRVVEAPPEKTIPDDIIDTDREIVVHDDKNRIQSKLGDVWLLGEHRLMCGNATSERDVDILLNGKQPILLFCDPPYGMKKESMGVIGDNMTNEELLDFNIKWLNIAFDRMPKVGSVYVWGLMQQLCEIYVKWLEKLIRDKRATYRNFIVWNKNSAKGICAPQQKKYAPAYETCLFFTKGYFGEKQNRAYFNNTHCKMTDVWSFSSARGKEREDAGGHVTPKPLELCERAIKSSSRHREIVLDLFAGGGSTLIASHMCGRKCYTMEINPLFVDVVLNRWVNLTGDMPRREDDGIKFIPTNNRGDL